MSFDPLIKEVGTAEAQVFQMPAYEKTKAGEYAILPKKGAIRLSANNSTGSIIRLTIKQKTLMSLNPLPIGELDVPANGEAQWPVPISLGPGEYVTASADATGLTLTGSVAASPLAPQTAANQTIWTPFTMRRPIAHEAAWAVASQTFGAAVAGYFYMGVIDTIKGTIDTADAYQTGDRYALLVSPKDLERGSGLRWCAKSTDVVITGALTRWNGLEATNTLIGLNDPDYEVADYIEGLRSTDAPPATEGGSDIYLPAFDELELLYRNGKPNGEDNRTDGQSFYGGAFPSSINTHGTNPSSDPTGAGYINNPRNPDKTPLAAFAEGGSQVLRGAARYWTSTDADGGATEGRSWGQNFWNTDRKGLQSAYYKGSSLYAIRPVRRIYL